MIAELQKEFKREEPKEELTAAGCKEAAPEASAVTAAAQMGADASAGWLEVQLGAAVSVVDGVVASTAVEPVAVSSAGCTEANTEIEAAAEEEASTEEWLAAVAVVAAWAAALLAAAKAKERTVAT